MLDARRGLFAAARGLLALALLGGAGCVAPGPITQTPFQRTASDIASVLSAAETTLDDAHNGRLTFPYATAAFVNYADKLEGSGEQLPGLEGAPDAAQVATLQSLLAAAQPVIQSPCLDEGCEWPGQVETLSRAADAFEEASR